MSITSGLYNVLQQQATLDATRATTQDTQALAQTRMYGLMQTIQTQQAIRDQLAKANAASNFDAPPGMGPGQQAPSGTGYGILDPMQAQVSAMQKQANTWDGLANAVMAVNPDESRKYQELALKTRNEATQKSLEIVRQQMEFDKHVGGLAGAAAEAAKNGDQASMMSSLQQMAAMNPQYARMPLERDANGIPAASPANARAFSNVSLSKMTAGEQTTEGLRQATLAETVKRDQTNEEIRRQNLGIEQQRANTAAAAAQASADLRRESLETRQIGQATTINNQYENQSKDFKEIVPRMQSATNYLIDAQASAEQGKPVMKPNGAFNPAGDRMFGETYIKLIYPEFKGSVYDQKALDSLPGIPTKIVQGIKNAFQGKGIDRDTKADMYGAMQMSFKPMNDMQTQREDAAQARALRSGVPPDMASVYIPPYALRPAQEKSSSPASAAPQNSQFGGAPPAAIEFLKSNPSFREQFKAKYGYVPAGM